MAGSSTQSFFDSWQTYQKVVAADLMYHREIAQDLERLLAARFKSKPFSFIDLGCGDAANIVPVLKGLPVERYKGVDLSETALALARTNLAALGCPAELAHGDISAALEREHATFDVIHCSFALHHLSTLEKAAFFCLTEKRLAHDGLLLITDVMREEDESLSTYYAHYCAWLRESWSNLDAQEKDAICAHIMSCDRPEPPSVLRAQAQAAGLGKASEIARYNWHRVLCFMRD